MQSINQVILTPARTQQLQRLYVTLSFDLVGRALEAASQLDDIIQHEIAGLPIGYLFEMGVIPQGPAMYMQKQADGTLRYLGSQSASQPQLGIQIKHIAHAFSLLSFQESTASAFANDRMVVDGDISLAMKVVRSLNRLECLILPKLIA
ncbi:MAG TPA: hypothetical protein VFM46_09475, partial [Pseudomonadales bacterium]|nr:hypothetical protein [Pseudomonadales bacterium]